MLSLLRMQSDLCHTVWFFCALILYTCTRELIVMIFGQTGRANHVTDGKG